MAVKIKCPNPDCQKVLMVPEEMGGKKGKCSNCGTTFLIPKVEKPAAPAAPKAAPKKPAPQKRAQADHLEDFDVGDDFSSPPQKSRRAAPPQEFDDFDDHDEFDDRPRRRAPARDEYDDFDDYGDEGYDDYDGGFGGGGGGGYGAPSMARQPQKTSWHFPKIGMFICAIGFTVFAGTHALRLLADLFALIITIMGTAGTMSGIGGFAKAADVILKIDAPIFLGALVTVVVGIGFCIAATTRGGVMALAITGTALGAALFVLTLVFYAIPLYSERSFLAFYGAIGSGTGAKIGALIVVLVFVGFFIVAALLFKQTGQQMKNRTLTNRAPATMYMAIAAGGVKFILAILVMINWPASAAKAIIWILLLLNIAGDVLMGLATLFFATMLFAAKRTWR